MRWTTFTVVILGLGAGFVGPAFGQMPSLGEQQEAMADIRTWVGEWRGTGWEQRGPDPASRSEFDAHEVVEERLGGLVYLVRGQGTVPGEDGSVRSVHESLATLHWSEAAGRWEFQTHTADGHHVSAPLERLDDGRLRWGFDMPGGAVRFTIELEGDRFSERGEITFDGETWYHFFDVTMERVEA